MFYVWWPYVSWSWPWTELNIKHLLNQCLAAYFRSTRSKFWPKNDNFEVSTARNLKAPILIFDLTLTWYVTSFGKIRGCYRIVSLRAFERRVARLYAAIRSRGMTWGRLTRALLGLWIFHDLLGGGVWTPPRLSRLLRIVEQNGKTAFESSRKIISKSFRSFFVSGQNWGRQGSKFQNFPKRFLDDKIFNFKGRATILIPSCLSRQGASNHV